MDIPKAFVELAGRTLLERSVAGALASGIVTHVVVAVPEALVRAAEDRLARTPALRGADPGAVRVVAGGADRSASVYAGLTATPESARFVLVHDAARCLTPPEVFARVVEALRAGAQGVVPVLPVVDTVKRAAGPGPHGGEVLVGDLDRTALRRVQTPQGFPREILLEAHRLQEHDPDPLSTDDAMLVERLGCTVESVSGDERALKITHPVDLRIAGWYLEDEAE